MLTTMDPQVTPKLNNFTDTQGESYAQARPPLFHVLGSLDRLVYGSIFLAVLGGKVLVHHDPSDDHYFPEPPFVGAYRHGEPKGPPYTGPITAAMKAEIQKWI